MGPKRKKVEEINIYQNPEYGNLVDKNCYVFLEAWPEYNEEYIKRIKYPKNITDYVVAGKYKATSKGQLYFIYNEKKWKESQFYVYEEFFQSCSMELPPNREILTYKLYEKFELPYEQSYEKETKRIKTEEISNDVIPILDLPGLILNEVKNKLKDLYKNLTILGNDPWGLLLMVILIFYSNFIFILFL